MHSVGNDLFPSGNTLIPIGNSTLFFDNMLFPVGNKIKLQINKIVMIKKIVSEYYFLNAFTNKETLFMHAESIRNQKVG